MLGRAVTVLLATLLVATAAVVTQASALEPVEVQIETGLIDVEANTSGPAGGVSVQPHLENATEANDSARANASASQIQVEAEVDGGEGHVNVSTSPTTLRVSAGDGELLEISYRPPASVEATEEPVRSPTIAEPADASETSSASQAAASPEEEASELAWTIAPVTGLAAAAAAGHALPVTRWARRLLGLAPVAPMFSRIARSEVLDHEAREAIYELLDEQAGLSLEAICRELDLARSTARHHVRKLEQTGMIEHTRLGRARVHHLVGQRHRAVREHLLTNETRAAVYETIEDDALTITEIAHQLEANPGSVHFHLGKLTDVGLVETVGEDGRRYRVRELDEDALASV